jgi:hypothetical protein
MGMVRRVVLCLAPILSLSAVALAASSDVGTDPNTGLPTDFPQLRVFWTPKVAPGVIIGNLGKTGGYRVIMDSKGVPVYYSKDETFVTKNVVSNGLIAYVDKKEGRFYLKDESFAVVDSFIGSNDRFFIMLANGNAITAAGGSRQIDMSQIVPGGRPDAVIDGKSFVEMDANKQVVFEWNCLDYIPITETYAKLTDKSIDFTHLNYVSIDSVDHNYILSDRHACSIMKISRSTGQILWRLGGVANAFKFIGEHEENAPMYFAAQHSVLSLPNGNLLFFDNGGAGAELAIPERLYSRVVEYKLDEVNKTATLVWEYRHTPDIYADSGGELARFANGNTYIGWGSALRGGKAPLCTEVNSAGETVFEMSFADPNKADEKAIIVKRVWNSPEQVKSQTFTKVKAGQTYSSTQAGVSVKVNTVTASPDYFGLVVKKHDVAVRFPRFSGKAPWVLDKRVTLAGFGVTGLAADLTFDTKDLGCPDPTMLTVYYRPSTGQGEFTPLATVCDRATGQLSASGASFGEFVFGYPDLPEVALPPILHDPADQKTVNQTQPVVFTWSPQGFGRSYHVQVATDPQFTSLVADQSTLTQATYTLSKVQAGATYFWRVNTTNYGGTGQWAGRSFTAAAPFIKVTAPNGGEAWNRGLTYFIRWDTNLTTDVAIELYRAADLVKTLSAKASNTGTFEWEADLALSPGDDYAIKVKSATDATIADTSDAPFSIR